MIWPFEKKNNPPDKARAVRSPPRASESKRTWQLLQVEPALTCNLACVMCPWRGEAGRSDGSGLMDQRVWAAVKSWLHEVEMVDFRRNTCRIQAKAYVDNALVTEATFMAAVVDR